MPEGDFDAIGKSGCQLAGAAGIIAGILLLLGLLCALSCASTAPPPIPTPAPLPAVVTDYVPVYDSCPPPPDLQRPLTWQILVDGILSDDLGVKLLALEYAYRSAVDYAADLEVMLQPYRVPPPTPTPRPQ